MSRCREATKLGVKKLGFLLLGVVVWYLLFTLVVVCIQIDHVQF